MKTVRSQAELDAAIKAGDPDIIINSRCGVWLTVGDSATVRACDSATVRAWGSATVEACDSATVRACDSATVRAWGSATVRASGSATVEASGSATVEASGSATVRAWGSATVRAWGSATVRASGSATVEASGSATVEASGSATVEASDSATVEASDSATVRACDSATVRACDSATVRACDSATVRACDSATVRACDSATVRAWGSATVEACDSATVRASPLVAVHLHSGRATVQGGVLIDLTAVQEADPAVWCDVHGVIVTDGVASLYKALDGDLTAGHGYRPTRYNVGSEPVASDFQATNQCGRGLHLSPTTWQATTYRMDAKRWVRVEVPVSDIVPIPSLAAGHVAKCKVRSCRVVAEVDRDGQDLAVTA